MMLKTWLLGGRLAVRSVGFGTLLAISSAHAVAEGQIDAERKHLFDGEAATLKTIEFRVQIVPHPSLLPTAPFVAAQSRRDQDGSHSSDLPAAFLPGVNPMVPPTAAGVIGVGIAAAIVHLFAKPDLAEARERVVKDRHHRQMERVKQLVSRLQPQLNGLDIRQLIQSEIESQFENDSETSAIVMHRPQENREKTADAVLTVAFSHAFYDWAMPRRDGVPRLPPGILLDQRATVTLTRRDGAVLVRDIVIFETPHSADPDDDARVEWWAAEQRYRAFMQMAGRAIALALARHVLGPPRYANQAAYEAQTRRDRLRAESEREADLLTALDRFRGCRNFDSKSPGLVALTSFRAQADGDIYVGLDCEAGQSR